MFCVDCEDPSTFIILDCNYKGHNIFFTFLLQHSSQKHCFILESIYESSSVYEPKKARSYQIELAQPAFDGKNTLINAPTGKETTIRKILLVHRAVKDREL